LIPSSANYENIFAKKKSTTQVKSSTAAGTSEGSRYAGMSAAAAEAAQVVEGLAPKDQDQVASFLMGKRRLA
jgi:hypothetical protein